MTTVEHRESAVSTLDEGGLLGPRYTVVGADNATLRLRDAAGEEHTCTDLMSAYASVNFGHRNPQIEAALADGSGIAALFYPPEAELVAAWLAGSVGTDGAPRRTLFQIGGSFAVATALALARRHRPGRVVAVEGAFHGLGVDALAVTTVQRQFALQDTGFAALLSAEVTHVRPGAEPPSWDGVSCLIYEPVQGANGYVPLDPEWLARLHASAQAAGVVVIADEIQCGFHRHGPLSPSRAAGLDPDIVLFGKSLTNGMYPLSAVVYRAALEPDASPVQLAHTFQTGALGYRAAWRVAQYLAAAPIEHLCAAVTARLGTAAATWLADGLIEAVHVTGPALSFRPTRIASRDLVADAFARGVLPFSGGADGRRIRIAPPLTIPEPQLAVALDVLDAVLRA